jgi:predicted lysophospholipase L1 biosynthesis ABC-type transport system permease subunit
MATVAECWQRASGGSRLQRACVEPLTSVDLRLGAPWTYDSVSAAGRSDSSERLAQLITIVLGSTTLSYMVSRRQSEIDIRMALGADARAVVLMVVGESGRLLAVGTVIGLSLAAVLSQPTSTLLFGVQPWDPASFSLAVLVLTTVALMAAWIPARRPSRMSQPWPCASECSLPNA